MVDRTHRAFAEEDIQQIVGTYHNWRDDKDYEDIPGYCKSATLEEIAKHDYVLTPGRYVGIPPEPDDGIPFEDKMADLTSQLREQIDRESELNDEIQKQLEKIWFHI